MFAVIRTGGKQYRVRKDDVIAVEKLAGDAGEAISFTDVLMVAGDGEPSVGAPVVEGATVTAEVVEQTRGRKILVFKKKRRKNYRRTHGHRQMTTLVRITDILTGGAKPKAAAATKKAAAPSKAKVEPEPAAETVPKKAEAKPKADAKPKAEARPKSSARDDLKKIGGIGPVIETKLNALGVTTYAEIAAWKAADIARVEEELNFKGRVGREDWIAQAAKLAKEAKS